MAESVVTFLLENVSALLIEESHLLFGVREEVKSLRTELEWIRSFLRDADEKRKKNERVKLWEKHGAYNHWLPQPTPYHPFGSKADPGHQ
ncbi:hypothetical protein HHK36_014492 [Tetracentron sinense]|uniref:Disease resistance N-terminal domain-containing protein n=1 Tax=Tetracentron sinense TaxID=13715 RepID=A0A834Z2Q6_TETSI|nr:hypothetical protein HHK36_014492 [Tetracentron sinense]